MASRADDGEGLELTNEDDVPASAELRGRPSSRSTLTPWAQSTVRNSAQEAADALLLRQQTK